MAVDRMYWFSFGRTQRREELKTINKSKEEKETMKKKEVGDGRW